MPSLKQARKNEVQELEIDEILADLLTVVAAQKGVSPEQYLDEIIKNHLD